MPLLPSSTSLPGACALALILALPATAAADWRTLPVRDGDNASTLFDRAGVGQSVLFSLMNEPAIALHLAGLQPGDTVEVRLVDGELDHLRLFSGDEVALRARPLDEGWRVQPIVLNAYGLIALRIRHLETTRPAGAPVNRTPAPAAPPPVTVARVDNDLSTSETIAAEIRETEPRLHARVQAARARYVAARERARAREAAALADAREQSGSAPVVAAVDTASSANPAPTARIEAPAAASATPSATTESTGAATPPPASTAAAPATAAPETKAPETAVPAANPIAAAAAVPEKAPAPVPQPAVACPSIEGDWLANYATFQCETEVTFSSDGNGGYAMAQKGCGGITGKIRQDNRGLSGKWRHALCKGSLEVRLGASCDAGEGTWRPAKGERLCDEAKIYPVTIARLGTAQASELKAQAAAAAASATPPATSWEGESEVGDQ